MGRLDKLQRQSKERHSEKINPTCYLHIHKYIEKLEDVVERNFTPPIDFTKIDRFKKKKVEPETKKYKREMPRLYKESEVIPDKPKIIVRPPAEYSNKSPYGIASDLLLMK